jgi:hypothetical protein
MKVHLQHDRFNDGHLVDVGAEDVVLDREEDLKKKYFGFLRILFSGVNFSGFCRFSAKKFTFLLKTNVMIQSLHT